MPHVRSAVRQMKILEITVIAQVLPGGTPRRQGYVGYGELRWNVRWGGEALLNLSKELVGCRHVRDVTGIKPVGEA
jgi:hypothetical protein